jgi:hypothetical protein
MLTGINRAIMFFDNITYFKYSYKRQEKLKEFQCFTEVKPHKILQNSQTRWLSLLAVVKRVIEQYNALKLFFQSEYLVDRIQVSETIHNRLSDPIILCYLEFLEYVLPFVVDINLEFQSQEPKVHLLHERMSDMYKTILEFYIKPNCLEKDLETVQYANPANFVHLENVYLGPKVTANFCNNEFNFSDRDKSEFRKRCLDFLIELARQIYKRSTVNLHVV